LGEGDTPLVELNRLGGKLGLARLHLKDEGRNPTGTFKARGLSVAISKAKELGIQTVVIPTAGNAGGATAAYAARAGLQAQVFMPADSPIVNQIEVRVGGATLHLVDGLISDAGQSAVAAADGEDWFNLSTFKEPYRVEGKKTMGYELAETFDWSLPDVIIYPTGGGTGLVGMWKAFDELEQLGWIGSKRPRMVSVQPEGCAPIVEAFRQGWEEAKPWENASTLAHGLRVPHAYADRQILRVLRESQGTAIAVSDVQIKTAREGLAQLEGLLVCFEGAATIAGLEKLLTQAWLDAGDEIVLFNTGSGLKDLT
jgi:threonine synthase